MDEQEKSQDSPPQQPPQASSHDAEAHRGFVREMNSAFSLVYGYGGAVVLVLAAGVLLVAWNLGLLWTPAPWVLAVTVFLVGLFVLRIFVRRRANHLLDSIRQYCEINDLTVEQLRSRYADEALYPYFDSIFEVVERRRQLRE
jgi:FtsH-binding integral membrane protein